MRTPTGSYVLEKVGCINVPVKYQIYDINVGLLLDNVVRVTLSASRLASVKLLRSVDAIVTSHLHTYTASTRRDAA